MSSSVTSQTRLSQQFHLSVLAPPPLEVDTEETIEDDASADQDCNLASASPIQGSVSVLYRARDTIYCESCNRNDNVVIDSEKHFATVFRSWMFDYYRCTACQISFRQAGMPIVLPGSILFGISILVACNFIRSFF